MITPVNTALIAKAVQSMLLAWQPLLDLGVQAVSRGEYLNETPGMCPWVGIYPLGEEYVSRTLGLGAGFRMQHTGFAVIVQATDNSSGQACQDALEGLKQAVISCLLSDPSLGGTVQVIDKFSVRYVSYNQQAGQPALQSAIINFTGLVPVSSS